MNRRFFHRHAAAAVLTVLALGTSVAGAQNLPANKVVIQVSDADPGKWNLALNNAANIQEDLGAANVAIEIVAYGPGLGMLKLESTANSRVSDAMKKGIKVVACENTMRNQKLTKDDMLPALSYAPAGVVEIMKRQREGWAYIRP